MTIQDIVKTKTCLKISTRQWVSSVLVMLGVLVTTQAQAGSCKVDTIRLTEVEVRKPAKALDSAGTALLSTVISAGAMKVASAGLTAASSSFRAASQAGKFSFVASEKVIGKIADLGVSELISYFDDSIRDSDDLIIRVGGRRVYNEPKELPLGIFDKLSPNYEGSFIDSFSIQLIEYDSLSVNDNLGTIYGRNQNGMVGQLSPRNRESLEIMTAGEEDSHYKVSYEIIPGTGNLNDIPERLFCNSNECVDAREEFPSDIYILDQTLSKTMDCPDGYKDAGGYKDGDDWYRVCEMHTTSCGEPFKRLVDIGGVSQLKTGDVIVLRGITAHQSMQLVSEIQFDNTIIEHEEYYYLSNSYGNGQYLGVCTDCTGTGRPNAGLYFMDRDRTATHWTVTKMPNGKFALQGSNGQYLARCQGCSSMLQAAYVHVTDPNASWAQFTIAQSPTPSGDFIYTLQSDIGAYLSSCLGCGDMDNYKLGYGYAGSFHVYDANNGFAKWSIGVKQAGWDSDSDGVFDSEDAFPDDPNETQDSDGDGIGDNADAFPFDPSENADSDGDGVANNADACPNDSLGTVDTDNDGVCNYADLYPDDFWQSADSDDDGVGDYYDRFPLDPGETLDSDWDGVGNNSDSFPYDDNNLRNIEVDNSNGWEIEYASFADPLNSPTPDEVVKQDWPVYFKLTGGTSGSTARVTFTYENAIDPGAVLFKILCSALSCLDVGLPEDSYYITNQSLLIEGNKITVIFEDNGIGDEDGIANSVIDNAMLWAPWAPALIADGTPLVGHNMAKPEPADSDADSVRNFLDNCIEIANVDQRNTNAGTGLDMDGFGNICDPDLNNDLKVDFADLAILKSVFFTNDNPDADLNGDGKADFADLAILKSMFFTEPGPSGLVP